MIIYNCNSREQSMLYKGAQSFCGMKQTYGIIKINATGGLLFFKQNYWIAFYSIFPYSLNFKTNTLCLFYCLFLV